MTDWKPKIIKFDPDHEPRTFFRCHYKEYCEQVSKVIIVVEEYLSYRRTPKGHWVVAKYLYEKAMHSYNKTGSVYGVYDYAAKWLSDTSGKRFAYPTVEEARNSLACRCVSRLAILKKQLSITKAAYAALKKGEDSAYQVNTDIDPTSYPHFLFNKIPSLQEEDDVLC